MDRYQIVEGSASAHCCFSYSVVDTHRSEIIGGKPWVGKDGKPTYVCVCECFEEEYAELICTALNLNHTKSE